MLLHFDFQGGLPNLIRGAAAAFFFGFCFGFGLRVGPPLSSKEPWPSKRSPASLIPSWKFFHRRPLPVECRRRCRVPIYQFLWLTVQTNTANSPARSPKIGFSLAILHLEVFHFQYDQNFFLWSEIMMLLFWCLEKYRKVEAGWIFSSRPRRGLAGWLAGVDRALSK